MENVLKARITADVSGLIAGLSQAEKNLERARGIFEKSSKSVFALENSLETLAKRYREGAVSEAEFAKKSDQLSRELIKQRDNVRAAGNEVKRLNDLVKAQNIRPAAASVQILSDNTKGLATNTRGANTVALEFNRIIQDAPFGIIGVGNNIQQLAANFSNLQKNAGGTGPALKAAFSALVTGPNIALLAISALTTGLTLYQMGAFKSKEETKDLAEELSKFRENLDGVNRALIEGESNATKEAQSLALLRAQAENVNIPLAERNKAVAELQAQYPDYLGNLTQDQILTGNVGGAYEELSKQLIASAKAKAAYDEIAKNSLTIRTLEFQAEQRALEISKLREDQDRARARDLVRTQGGAASGRGATLAISEAAIIEGQILKLVNEQLDTVNEINKVKQVDADLESKIVQLVTEGARFTGQVKENISKSVEESEKLKVSLASIFNVDQVELNRRIAKALGGIKNDEFTQVKVKVDFQPEQLDKDTQDAIENMSRMRQEVAALEMGFERLLERNALGILTQTAGGFGNEIARSFETGNQVLDAFIRNLFRSIPQIISAYAKLAAARKAQAATSNAANATEASGLAVVIGANAAKALGPLGLAVLPVFIAGALAIIAGAFKGKGGGNSGGGGGSAQSFGNMPGREFGGPVYKNQAYIVGEKRPEIFVPSSNGVIIPQIPDISSSANRGGRVGEMLVKVEVEGRISGESIRLSNRRAGNKVSGT